MICFYILLKAYYSRICENSEGSTDDDRQLFEWPVSGFKNRRRAGMPDLCWYMIPNAEIMYQINTKTNQMVIRIINVHKIFQEALKYINIFQSKALQNLPKFGFLVWKQTIWQPWWRGRTRSALCTAVKPESKMHFCRLSSGSREMFSKAFTMLDPFLKFWSMQSRLKLF
jgi:hypothetical protein